MRGDDKALDLLVGIIGEREHDPVGSGARRSLALHLDAAHDAVRARSRRDEQSVALRIE